MTEKSQNILRSLPPDRAVFYTTIASELPDRLLMEPGVAPSILRRFRIRNPHLYGYERPNERLIRFDLSLGMAIREALQLQKAYERRSMLIEPVLVALPLSLVLHAISQNNLAWTILPDRPAQAMALYVAAHELSVIELTNDVLFSEIQFPTSDEFGQRPDYEHIELYLDSVLQEEADRAAIISHELDDFRDDVAWRQLYLEQAPKPTPISELDDEDGGGEDAELDWDAPTVNDR